MRTLALLLVVLAAFGCARASGQPDALARVRRAGVLRWGGDLQGGEPYVSEDPAHPGQLVGFEVELAEALARELGVRAEFVQNDWSALVPSLERGTFDVVLNGLEVTPARAGRIAFSRPYYIFAERLMARRADTSVANSLASLNRRRVGTLANSFAYDLLRNRAEVVPYEGVEEPYIDLSRGRIDAVLLDDIISERYGQQHADLQVVGDLTEGYYALGVRPADQALLQGLNTALAHLTESGELHRILSSSNIWNDRQRRLERWSDDDQRRMLAGATHASGMTAQHVKWFLKGALMTLWLSTLGMCLAIPLGLALALARMYAPRPLRWLAEAYVEVYRGTPVLLQLYVIYYGLSGVIELGPMTAAVLGLGMNYAAYEAEVYRAGIQAVPKGQTEAARALGMTTWLTLRRIVLPQAFRLALPSVTNDFIALLKDSSMVSVITVVELTKQMTITAVDTRGWLLPGLLCAGLYFAMSYPLSRLARVMERRLARS